ncbi:MAG: hypothetical protein VB046_14130 [Paludibacter sp.]|nr:hypothetical protein [Paludibacter sp.]
MPIILTVPSIALVDFAGYEKRISYKTGNGAEQIINPTTHDKTWINYSCINEGNATSVISVSLSSDDLPANIVIKLDVSENKGGGAGKTGRPVGPVVLRPYPQDIIVEIGTCYTGRGINKGHQLTYSWEWLSPYNPDQLSARNIEIAVTYTITTAK